MSETDRTVLSLFLRSGGSQEAEEVTTAEARDNDDNIVMNVAMDGDGGDSDEDLIPDEASDEDITADETSDEDSEDSDEDEDVDIIISDSEDDHEEGMNTDEEDDISEWIEHLFCKSQATECHNLSDVVTNILVDLWELKSVFILIEIIKYI